MTISHFHHVSLQRGKHFFFICRARASPCLLSHLRHDTGFLSDAIATTLTLAAGWPLSGAAKSKGFPASDPLLVVFFPSSSYGCCQDGLTMSQGANGEGCAEFVAPAVRTVSIRSQWTGPGWSAVCCVVLCPMEAAEGVFVSVQAAPSLPVENAVQCRTTTYGCCFDRTTPAGGPNGEGCPDPPHHSKSITMVYSDWSKAENT